MSDHTGRFEWVLRVSRIALILTLAVLAVMLTLTISMLIYFARTNPDWIVLLQCSLFAVGELMAAGWAFVMYGVVQVAVQSNHTLNYGSNQLGRIETLMEDQSASARKMIDLSTLSDEAKSLLYRDRECEAMRETIHGMLVRQDYRSAEALIAGLEQRPSYAQEAAAMRDELASTRKATLEEKVDLAVRRVEAIIANKDWARALREAERMMQAMPDIPKISDLPKRIDAARTKHKRDLLQAYGESVRRNDVDGSIDLLKQLDCYLTPQEAAALQESARGMFRAKLHNMGVQFAIHVAESQWIEAIATGEEIVANYPNSRMAFEVRSKLDLLRQRAAAPNAPTAGATP